MTGSLRSVSIVQETFIPQSYDWGVEAQVDWYEAYADLSWRENQAAGVRDAQHGQWRRLSLRVFTCDPAGFSGSA